jgi:galactose-1-phosphate uridylyltransferase
VTPEGLTGEAAPERLTPEQEAAVARIVEAVDRDYDTLRKDSRRWSCQMALRQ